MDPLFIILVSAFVFVLVITSIAFNYEYVLSKALVLKDELANKVKVPKTNSVKRNGDLILNTSFEDVTGGSELIETMSDSMMKDINKSIIGSSIGLSDSLIKGVEYIQESNEYIVKFSKEGQKLLKSDTAKLVQKKSGELIPQLKKGGKFVEHAELTGKGRKALKNLSKVSTLVVGVAHMVSGADMAKKLDELLEKVDFIIADRENERMAELESIYKIVKEILIENNGNLKPEDVRESKRLLYKLRSNWRRNAKERLESIRNPEKKYWFKHIFARKSVDLEVYKVIKDCMADLQNVRSSLLLQLAISYETDTLENFQANMLQDEINGNKEVLKVLRSKGEYISGRYMSEEITSTKAIEFLETHIEEQKALRMDYNSSVKEIRA